MELTGTKALSGLLKKYGFVNRKRLGQNFIVNPKVCPKIAAAKDKGGLVLEIGPGVGTLTTELAKTSDYVVAIEKDKRLIPVLHETLKGYGNIKIVVGDALKVDFSEIISGLEFEKLYVCANLPYYITTPIIIKLLESRLPINKIIVMVQKETALRICADPPSNEASSISYAVRYYSRPKILFYVKRGSFYPPPKVDSAVLELTVTPPPVAVENHLQFLQFIKTCFCQKRKLLVNSIGSSYGLDKNTVQAAFEMCGLAKSARPNNLILSDYAGLYNFLKKYLEK